MNDWKPPTFEEQMEHLKVCAESGLYFEICAESAAAFYAEIVQLLQRIEPTDKPGCVHDLERNDKTLRMHEARGLTGWKCSVCEAVWMPESL